MCRCVFAWSNVPNTPPRGEGSVIAFSSAGAEFLRIGRRISDLHGWRIFTICRQIGEISVAAPRQKSVASCHVKELGYEPRCLDVYSNQKLTGRSKGGS